MPAHGGQREKKGFALNDVVTALGRWLVRAVLLALGLVFFLSLLAAAAVLAAVWALRVLWARLTGGVAVPYPRMSPRQGFAKVYRYGQRGAPADVTDVPSREVVREVAREVREP